MSVSVRIVSVAVVLTVLIAAAVLLLSRGGHSPSEEASEPQALQAPDSHPEQENREPSPAAGRRSAQPAAAPEAPGEEAGDSLETGPGLITGAVVDRDGHAVDGATVELSHYNWRDPDPAWNVPLIRATISSEEGLFEFSGLPLRGYTIHAATDDRSGQCGAYLRNGSASAEAIIVLEPAWRLRGNVVDPEGKGVAGALLQVVEKKGQRLYERSPMNMGARCGKDGAFELAHLPLGEWRFLIKAEGYPNRLTDFVAHNAGEVTFVLTEGGSLRGKAVLVDSGDPVAGLVVTAVATDAPADRPDATTEAQGRFSFPALRAAEYSLGVRHERLVLKHEAPKVHVARGKEAAMITLEVTEGATVSGRVVDEETGAGVAGVTITAREGGNAPTRVGHKPKEAESGADGAYHLAGLAAGPVHISRGDAPGYQPATWQEYQALSAAVGRHFEDIDFKLRRGCAVSGTVLGSDGEPLSGAQVLIYRRQSGESASAQTGADGRFTLSEFSSGANAMISARKGEAASLEEGPLDVPPEGLSGILLTLSEALTASIEGVLVDHAGRPQADYTVLANVVGGSPPASRSATTDADGRFKVLFLAAGAYLIQVRSPGTYIFTNASGAESIELKSGEARKGLRLVVDNRDEASISGRVTDEAGQPIRDVHVNSYGPMNASAVTDTDGKYRITGLKPGEYQMGAYHAGYSHASANQPVPAGSRNIDFVLEGTGAVEGHVIDAATGEPVTRFEVGCFPGAHEKMQDWMFGQFQFAQVRDPEGHFRTQGVRVGEATVFVRAAGYATGLKMVGYVKADETITGVRVELEGGGAVEGIVTDLDGVPLSGVSLFLGDLPREWVRTRATLATTGDDGTFRIDALSPDDRRITAYLDGYAPSRARVRPRPGRVDHVEIRLKTGGEIQGTVTAGGKPLPGVSITARKITLLSSGSSAQATTNRDGFYRLPGLADGDFQVRAYYRDPSNPDRSRSLERPAIIEGGMITQVDIDFDESTSAIEGLVTVDGQPAENAYVSVRVEGSGGGEESWARADSEGRFHIGPTPAGTAILTVSAGERRRVLHVEVPTGTTVQQDVSFAGAASITGTVVGFLPDAENGVAVLTGNVAIPENGAAFDLDDLARLSVNEPDVDENGNFLGENIEPGLYTVVAYSIPETFFGYRYRAAVVELEDGEETVLDFDLNWR